MSNLRLSEKHGVNPMIPVCFYCNKEKNEIALLGKLKPEKDKHGRIIDADPEAPRMAVLDKVPCDECLGWMEKGIILISCKDEDEGDANPYRTGGWSVATEDYVRRVVSSPEVVEAICQKRVAFVPDQVWDKLGLPR